MGQTNPHRLKHQDQRATVGTKWTTQPFGGKIGVLGSEGSDESTILWKIPYLPTRKNALACEAYESRQDGTKCWDGKQACMIKGRISVGT